MSVNFTAWRFTKGKEGAPHYKASFKDDSGKYHDIASVWVKQKEDGEKYLSIAVDEDGFSDYMDIRQDQKGKPISTKVDAADLPF